MRLPHDAKKNDIQRISTAHDEREIQRNLILTQQNLVLYDSNINGKIVCHPMWLAWDSRYKSMGIWNLVPWCGQGGHQRKSTSGYAKRKSRTISASATWVFNRIWFHVSYCLRTSIGNYEHTHSWVPFGWRLGNIARVGQYRSGIGIICNVSTKYSLVPIYAWE